MRAFNPRPQEAEAGRTESEASLVYKNKTKQKGKKEEKGKSSRDSSDRGSRAAGRAGYMVKKRELTAGRMAS